MQKIELVDGLSYPALKKHLEIKRHEIEALENEPRQCWSCQNLNREGGPACKLYNAAPPREFLDQGCDAWTFDYIPF